jgi:REP element-mobilizing transposase RayT
MPRRLRYFPDRPLVEVTARTVQGRFLLKPSTGLREIFIGILARAAERYDVEVHAFVCLSNHYHLLCSPADAHALASLMLYLNTNLSKEAGRLHRWRGPLLQRRYQAIVVSNEDKAQIARLRYLYAYALNDPLNYHDPSGLLVLPANPSDLPGEWVRDPTHRDPNGQRFRHPDGDVLDFHRGRPGETGWTGRDHWHHNGGKEHLKPGREVPDPAPSAPCEYAPPEPPVLTPELVGAAAVAVGAGIIIAL